jgi:hypothetical protein
MNCCCNACGRRSDRSTSARGDVCTKVGPPPKALTRVSVDGTNTAGSAGSGEDVCIRAGASFGFEIVGTLRLPSGGGVGRRAAVGVGGVFFFAKADIADVANQISTKIRPKRNFIPLLSLVARMFPVLCMNQYSRIRLIDTPQSKSSLAASLSGKT